MSVPALKKYGCFAVRDSGAPPNSRDYTTLIVFHGMAFHSAIFDKLFPLVEKLNVRLVAANRPDYPGATPLSDQERMQLQDIANTVGQDPQSAASSYLDYLKAGAKKTHDFLVEFISKESIPVEGGVVVAGWSLATTTILGLVAYADAVSSKEFDLRTYIKHVVLYDPPSFLLGFAPPSDILNPFFDPSVTPSEALKIFPQWVSGYYAHGEGADKLEYKALEHPLPTMLSMNPSELQQCMEVSPALPGGSDEQLFRLGVQSGAFIKLREIVVYLDKGVEDPRDGHALRRWDDVEIKQIWCDQSVWESTWAFHCLQSDLDDRKKAGKMSRKVDMVRLRGGNHFYHWDQPEATLKALLTGVDM